MKYVLCLCLLSLPVGCQKQVEITETNPATTKEPQLASQYNPSETVLYYWSIAYQDKLIIRTLVDQGSQNTPSISWTDGDRSQTESMQLRAKPNDSFPVRVFEYAVDGNATQIEVQQTLADGSTQKLSFKNSSTTTDPKIAILGDTGCRQKKYRTSDGFKEDCQDCADPIAWPYRAVAGEAALEQPDLILHVGDYHYRERGCDCNESSIVCGDVWQSWQQDFFEPAKNLLAAAPMVVTRGNHEDCTRAWSGWNRFMEPADYWSHCETFPSVYSVFRNGLLFIVADIADAGNYQLSGEQKLDGIKRVLKEVNKAANNNQDKRAILLTHQPLWGYDKRIAEAFDQALNGQLADSIVLYFAGHQHRFHLETFDDGNPPQFVIGNSGTKLDSSSSNPEHNSKRFGYALLFPSSYSDDWPLVRKRQLGGESAYTIDIADKSVTEN